VLPLIWRPEARQGLLDITSYIAERSPAAARIAHADCITPA